MKPTKKAAPFMARQGDVLLIKVDADFSADPIKPPTGEFHLLALGETTGHAHYLLADTAVLREPSPAAITAAAEAGVRESQAVLWTVTILPTETDEKTGTTLYHGTPTTAPQGPADADHAFIAMEPGTYVVLRQREYDDQNDYRQVAD